MSIPFFTIFQLFPHQLFRSRLKSGSGMSFCSLKRCAARTGTPKSCSAAQTKERRREPARQPSSRQSAKIYSTKTNLGAQSEKATRRRSPPTVSRWAASRQLQRKGKRDNLLRRAKKIPPKREKDYRAQNKNQSNKPKETTCFILETIKPRRVEAIPNKIKNCHIEPQRKSSAIPSGFSIDGNKIFKYEKNLVTAEGGGPRRKSFKKTKTLKQ